MPMGVTVHSHCVENFENFDMITTYLVNAVVGKRADMDNNVIHM